MYQSEILKEKNRVQSKLSRENVSIHEYLKNSHSAAEKISKSYGFKLRYSKRPHMADFKKAQEARDA